MKTDRRTVLAGLTAFPFLSAASSATIGTGPLFTSGLLARNPVARSFEKVRRGVEAPAVELLGLDGRHDFAQLKGRTRIVSLWAEWCLPCLVEAKDLAALRSRYGAPSFDILAILTAGRSDPTPQQAVARLRQVGAGGLPTWVEPRNGRQVGLALAVEQPPHISIPCNLLIDSSGRVRGRSIGNGVSPGPTGRSHWATPAAAAFVAALRDGALDHV